MIAFAAPIPAAPAHPPEPGPAGGTPAADGREQRLGLDELFFSRTDRKGIIESGNDVFVRVSGYPSEELIGRPHNIVRHPDMPRAVFRVLWQHLEAGASVSAYVKNRAADGSYYWVLATIDPALDGYLSVRLKPSSELFAVTRSVYADVLAVEREVEGGDLRRRKAAIEAGVERLLELLAGAGFADYQTFIEAVLPAEVRGREALLSATAGERLGHAPAGADPTLTGILRPCAAAHELLDDVGANLERYSALRDTLAPKSAYVRELAENIRLFSLNALLGATRLGSRGAALGAVAEIMRGRSQTAGSVTDALSTDIGGAVDLLAGMGYLIAASKLQTEIMMVFIHELIAHPDHRSDATADLHVLAAGLSTGARRLCASLADLDRRLDGVAHHAGRMRAELAVVSRLEINGRIEAARLSDADTVLELFRTIGRQVGTARDQLADFGTADHERDEKDDALRKRLLDSLDELEDRMTRPAAGSRRR